MKKALIDPNASVKHVTEWVLNPTTGKYVAVFAEIPNSDRVAEVAEANFPVAPPLFWVDCADDVVADVWYYNNVTAEILIVPLPPPYPKT